MLCTISAQRGMEFASAEALPQREPRAKRQKAAAAGGARHEEPGDAERAGTAVIGSGADASGAPKTGDQASIDLPEYRSAAVKGQAFECKRAVGGRGDSSVRTSASASAFFVQRCNKLIVNHVPDLDHTADVQLHACK